MFGPVCYSQQLLLEDVFKLLKRVMEDIIFIFMIILLFFNASKLFEETFLLRRQIGWSHHLDNHMLIATSAAMHDWHAHALSGGMNDCSVYRRESLAWSICHQPSAPQPHHPALPA